MKLAFNYLQMPKSFVALGIIISGDFRPNILTLNRLEYESFIQKKTSKKCNIL